MKDEDEIEEMRQRLGEIAASDGIESGSRQWHKIDAAEIALAWALGNADSWEKDAIERLERQLEDL